MFASLWDTIAYTIPIRDFPLCSYRSYGTFCFPYLTQSTHPHIWIKNCTSVTLPKRWGLPTFIAQFENKTRVSFLFQARIKHFRRLVAKLQLQLQCSSLIYVHTCWISPNNPTRMIWTQSLYKKIWLTASLPEKWQKLLRLRTKKWPKTHTYAYIFELSHNFSRGSCRVPGRH